MKNRRVITILLYTGSLLCGSNVPIKGLKWIKMIIICQYFVIEIPKSCCVICDASVDWLCLMSVIHACVSGSWTSGNCKSVSCSQWTTCLSCFSELLSSTPTLFIAATGAVLQLNANSLELQDWFSLQGITGVSQMKDK